jgi:hypothetical protein
MKSIITWLTCFFYSHDWTSNAAQDIPPTPSEINQGVAGFKHYARMYCLRCGHYYRGNL